MNPSSFWQRLATRLMPYYWVVALFFLVLTVVSFKPAIKLLSNISTTLSTLLPEDYPSVRIANEIKNHFRKKGGGDLVIVLDSPNASANKQTLLELADYLGRLPEVEKVRTTKQGYDFFEKNKLLFLDLKDLETIRERIRRKIQREKLGALFIDFEAEEKKGQADPFTFDDMMTKYRDEYVQGIRSPFFTNEDQTVFALWVIPSSKDTSLAYYKKFFDFISGQVATFNPQKLEPRLHVGYAGSIKTRIDEYDALMRDLKVAGMISMVGVFVVLMIFFRRVLAVLLMFVPLVSGILIGFALCSLFIKNLNVVTSFLFSILFGLGIDIGIHMFSRYLEEREAGVDQHEALKHILFRTGKSSSVAVLTTVASFFILVINDFRGFSEFGWIAGIGLLVTLVVYLVFYPAILVLGEKIKFIQIKPHHHERRLKRLGRRPHLNHAGKIVGGLLTFMVGCVLFLPQLSFEWNYGILKIQIPETQTTREKLKKVSGRVNSPAAILIDGPQDAALLKDHFKQKREAPDSTPTIDKLRTSYDLNPSDQDQKMKVLSEIDLLLADDVLNVLKGDQHQMVDDFRKAIADTEVIDPKKIPSEIRDSFFGLEDYAHKQVAFIYPKPHLELDDGRNALAFFEDVHKTELEGKTFYAASDSLVFADVLKTLFRDSEIAISLSMLALLCLVWLDFKDLKRTGIVMGVLLFGMIGMCGLTAALGWKFNFYNMITIPIVIGMGEDNSVHLMHRFEELGRKSVMKALMSSGASAFMSSLTTLIGYSGLMFAHHPGLRSIGLFAVVGMITCMIGSLVLLPALLQLYVNYKNKKSVSPI